MIAIGVNGPETGACQVKRKLQFPACGVVIVMALGVHNAETIAETITSRLIEAL